MSYRVEKNGQDADLVFEGFERGIAPSPHKGVANLQSVNIATEEAEVMCSFARVQQSMTDTGTTGTLTFIDSSHVALAISGSNNEFKGSWITVTASTHSGELANGTYWVTMSDGAGFVLSATYNGSGISGYTTGLTATISLTRRFGTPVGYSVETYFSSQGTEFKRYYILDIAGLVWVYDTTNDVFPNDDHQNWFLPDTSITYFGSDAAPTGIAILNGWLHVISGNKIWVKNTNNLGASYTQMTDANLNGLPSVTTPHFAYVGHQGKIYYTDGMYIGSIFPNSSLQSNVSNIQSFCLFSVSSLSGTYNGNVSQVISGSLPSTGYLPGAQGFGRVPVVFYPAANGTLPAGTVQGTVYWIQYWGVVQSATVTGAISVAATSATLTSNWTGETQYLQVTFSNGNIRSVLFTNASTALTWSQGLTSGATATLSIGTSFSVWNDKDAGSQVDIAGGTGGLFFNTYYPLGTDAGVNGAHSTVTFSPQRLALPTFETSKAITEIGNTAIIGCTGNTLYPWNQIDNLPSGLIFLPESDCASLLTVNQMAYAFAGKKGNIYITDGSTASLSLKVPDYCAGLDGTPLSYIEPTFIWGGSMYLRGRVYFSIQDQTNTKDGNCGGIWSFYPSQNLYTGQDTGLALRIENRNSYGTYNGMARILIPANDQTIRFPQYWSAWNTANSGGTKGIDFTGTFASAPAVIETDLAPVGTLLNKASYKQLEFKLAAPMTSGDAISIKWRPNSTDAYTAFTNALVQESATSLSGYYASEFSGLQWVQFEVTLTPNGSTDSSLIRLKELRLR